MGDYFKIDREFFNALYNDKRLNCQDLGLLMTILSFEKKDISLSELKKVSKEGMETIKKGVKRLEVIGYLEGYSISK